jgi:carboxyl-terminal processing protease
MRCRTPGETLGVAICVLFLGALLYGESIPANAQIKTVPPQQRVLHEILASLYASAVHGPPLSSLIEASFGPLQKTYPCLRIDADQDPAIFSCDGEVLKSPYPPVKQRDASQLLQDILHLVSPDKEIPPALLSAMGTSMAKSIGDPYTAYIPASQVAKLQTMNRHMMAGPGILLSPIEPTRIRNVRPCSDAFHKKVLAGERILEIDGESTEGRSFTDLSLELLGQRGSMVSLIQESMDGSIVTTKVIRSSQQMDDVQIETLSDQIVYVQISQFSRGVAQEIFENLWAQKPRGLILDLRQNSGGLLTEGISLLELFFQSGPLGGLRPRPGRPAQDFVAQYAATDLSTPIVVLIDGGTASASEMVALVLQDRKRGFVMGARSMGKGSVQKTIQLPNQAVLKITSAFYVGANSQRLLRTGIVPDRMLHPNSRGSCQQKWTAKEDPWVIRARELLLGIPDKKSRSVRIFGPEPT